MDMVSKQGVWTLVDVTGDKLDCLPAHQLALPACAQIAQLFGMLELGGRKHMTLSTEAGAPAFS